MDAYRIFIQLLADARAHLAMAIRQMDAGTLRTHDGPVDTTAQSLEKARRDIVEIDQILERHLAGNVHKL